MYHARSVFESICTCAPTSAIFEQPDATHRASPLLWRAYFVQCFSQLPQLHAFSDVPLMFRTLIVCAVFSLVQKTKKLDLYAACRSYIGRRQIGQDTHFEGLSFHAIVLDAKWGDVPFTVRSGLLLNVSSCCCIFIAVYRGASGG